MSLTIPQALDLLMALVLAMFVPIGLWRGALREWIALAGILFGSALAAEWAGPWGGDLARQLALERRIADFTVASLFFLLVTLVVGYGAGVALPYRPDLSWPNRLLGAVLGLGNGALILSGALRIMQRHLFDNAPDSPLLTSGLANFLVQYVGWAQLALLAVLAGGVLAGLVRRWRGRPALLEEYAPGWGDDDAAYGQAAWEGDAAGGGYTGGYAAPPPVAWAPATRQAREDDHHAQNTTVLRPIPQWSARGATPPAAPIDVREIVEVAPTGPETPPIDDDMPTQPHQRVVGLAHPTAPPGANGSGSDARPDASRDEASPGAPAGAPGDPAPAATTTCAVCGAAVPARARFCPACGHIIGDAERRTIARLG